MKKILITGGAGFIGSYFVKLAVKSEYDVAIIDLLTYAGDLKRLEDINGQYRFYKMDIRDYSSMKEVFKKESPEIIVHFAAETHVDRSILEPSAFLKTNIEGTFNLLELAKKYKVELFLNIITDEVYGEIKEGKFTEESLIKPNSPYSVSKAAQDMLGRAYFRTYQLPVLTLRPSNNYGPWQYPEKLIPLVILKAMSDEPIPIYGDGSNVREWLYVEDCAKAILAVMLKGKPGEVYNIGSEIEKRNIDVVKAILNLLGKSENLITFIKDRPGHDYRYSLDITKIKTEINWKPTTNFEEGLKNTVKWYIKNFDWIKEKFAELKEYWNRVYKIMGI